MEPAVKYFFSYAREDSDFVLKLAKELRAEGVQIWLDQLDIVGGERWDSAVERALETAKALIVVLTPASLASHNVMDEVSYALEERKLVVPVIVRACTVPFRLRRVQRVDFTEDYEAAFAQLLRALGIQPALGGAPSGETRAEGEHKTRATKGILREEAQRTEAENARKDAQRKAREEAEGRDAEQAREEAEHKAREEAQRIAYAEAPMILVSKAQRRETERNRLTASGKQRAAAEHPQLEKSKRRVALVSLVAAAIIGAATLLAMNRSRHELVTPEPIASAPSPPATSSPPVTSAHAPGAVFQDCMVCPQMVVIPAGSFTMGSPASERGRDSDEGPQHPVTIARQFAAGRYEVTRGQFARFAQEAGYSSSGGCVVWNGSKWNNDASKDWRNPGFSQTDNDPVVCINWNDAKTYIDWLKRKTKNNYRLLTEAEWEYVARAGTTTPFSTGATINPTQANYNSTVSYGGSPTAVRREQTVPVGSYAPNAFGLYDVHGNVWEWTEDCWNTSYAGAPTDGSAWTNSDCGGRVLRGGSWGNDPGNLRSASRFNNTASFRISSSGFRAARTN